MTFRQALAAQVVVIGEAVARELARWCMAICTVVGHKTYNDVHSTTCLRCGQALRVCDWCEHVTPTNHACEHCGEDRPAW